MKAISIIILLAVFFSMPTLAEGSGVDMIEGYTDAIDSIHTWIEEVELHTEKAEDEDAAFIINQTIEEMLICEMAYIKASDIDQAYETSPISEDMEEITPEYEVLEEYQHIRCNWQKAEELDAHISCELTKNPSYIGLSMTACDLDGSFTCFRNIEVAKRESGEVLILLVDYNNTINATGRYAVLINDTNAKAIFTKTFGMTLDLILDVEEWQQGIDPGFWSKELLYPASYLYDD